ncbi:hypothetical protein HDU76_010448 [Blyttiomyces sp. JEL0837]|nr:hypothetical protein HDU76_010448 [Blyttiomyces sp. JEL0837]
MQRQFGSVVRGGAAAPSSPLSPSSRRESSGLVSSLGMHGVQGVGDTQAAGGMSDRIISVLSFEDCFWGHGEDPTVGVKRLYEIIHSHLFEIEEIITAIRQRINLEEIHSQKLVEFSRALTGITLHSGLNVNTVSMLPSVHGIGVHGIVPYSSIPSVASIPPSQSPISPTNSANASADNNNSNTANPSNASNASTPTGQTQTASTEPESNEVHRTNVEKPGGGATAEDESSLLPVVRSWGRLIYEMTTHNRRHADTLLLATLTPLQSFVVQHRKIMDKKKAEVDSNYKVLQKHHADVSNKRNAYFAKTQVAQSADEARVQAKLNADGAGAGGVSNATLEFHITDFRVWAQETEFYRLKVAREAFLALESAQLFTLESQTRLWTVDADPEAVGNGSASTGSTTSAEDAGPFTRLATPSPARGVENIAMRLRTGSRRPTTLLFEAVPNTSVNGGNDMPEPISPTAALKLSISNIPRQAFGIPLEDLARASEDPIPAIVRKCVAALYESQHKGRLRSGIDAWIRPNPDLPSVHFMRLEFNASLGGSKVSNQRLNRESPAVVAGVLKLFLLETPTSLCNHEVYDVLKIVYNASESAGVPEDREVRIKSVGSLLTTLNPSHYETLKVFAGLMHETVKDMEPTDKRLRRLAYSIAPCIIRPKIETSETLADEHPYLLTMDLLLYFPELFGGNLPASYFEAPPTPPASPEPEDDFFDDGSDLRGSGGRLGMGGLSGSPRGFRSGKSMTNLKVKEVAGGALEEVGNATASAWRGLVKSVSTLNLRVGSGSSAGSPANGTPGAVTASGNGEGDAAGATSGWFSWGGGAKPPAGAATPTAAAASSTPNAPIAKASMASLGSSFHSEDGEDLDVDYEPDVHPCHWAGCEQEFDSPEALIAHLSSTHMKPKEKVSEGLNAGVSGQSGNRRSLMKKGLKRVSAAVLPVGEADGEVGGFGGNEAASVLFRRSEDEVVASVDVANVGENVVKEE